MTWGIWECVSNVVNHLLRTLPQFISQKPQTKATIGLVSIIMWVCVCKALAIAYLLCATGAVSIKIVWISSSSEE